MKLVERKLVDRDEQLRTLLDLATECERGGGWISVVSGSVGCGKTELLQQVADRAAASGAVVLTAAASRGEQTLPLGVLGQLLHRVDLSPKSTALVEQLLAEGAQICWEDLSSEWVNQPTARVLHGLSMVLLAHANRTPLVICVDDVDYGDLPSLLCLSYLVRRVRSAPLLVILSETTRVSPVSPACRAELLRDPRCRPVQLSPLSSAAVADLLSQQLDDPTPELAAECYALSGGNPLLLQALIDDHRSSGPCSPTRLQVGDAFAEAVLSCLYRSEPVTLQVAQTLAVAGRSGSPAMLGHLLDIPTEMVGRAMELLNRAGVLDGGMFRHPHAREAVAASMGGSERRALHGRLARLLHADGGPAGAVARHLTLADTLDGSWAVPVLQETAEHALANGDIVNALSFLRSARVAALDERQRAAVTSRLARAEWTADPSGAVRHLPELVAAVRTGSLSGRYAVAPANYLLWHGRIDEAVEVLRTLCRAPAVDAQTARGLTVTLLWLAHLYPGHVDRVRDCWGVADRGGIPPAHTPPPHAAAVLSAMVACRPDGDAVAATEHLLHHTGPDDETLGLTSVTLSAAVFADRLGATVAWHDPLRQAPISTAPMSTAPTWHALMSGFKAEVALRRGDLPSAERYVRRGLVGISSKGWGVAIGGLLSTGVLAGTAAGRYDAVADYLAVPVPSGMFSSPFGLKYLRARGIYHLATGRVQAAVSDFQTCGDMMTGWGIDLPALIPWRTDLAQAYLLLGRHRRSRQLAQEQLQRLTAGQPRIRGITLRVLAAACEPARRLPLLEEAIELLETADDPLELAHAHADVTDALRDVGDTTRARTALRTAWRIATQCHAEALLRRLQPHEAPASFAPQATTTTGTGPTAGLLSDAERRVAALAAQGHTNREIAGRLYVTVSTVEQHLTRVYRKLHVSRRTDLADGLAADIRCGSSGGRHACL